MVVLAVLATAVTAEVAVDMEVEAPAAEVEATETPAVKILGGKHIIIALRVFGPFFSS